MSNFEMLTKVAQKRLEALGLYHGRGGWIKPDHFPYFTKRHVDWEPVSDMEIDEILSEIDEKRLMRLARSGNSREWSKVFPDLVFLFCDAQPPTPAWEWVAIFHYTEVHNIPIGCWIPRGSTAGLNVYGNKTYGGETGQKLVAECADFYEREIVERRRNE